MKILEKIEELRLQLQTKTKAIYFQAAGSGFLIAFYIGLVVAKKTPDMDTANIKAMWTWILIGIPIGVIELAVIWIHGATITKWVRNLANKKIDTIVMLSLIGLTWWLAGPFAAGYFFCGFLDNHFGEKQ